jgi:zinc-ribbon domain
MALIRCPDCGNEVSDQAPACPKCGKPISSAIPAKPKTTLTKPAGCFLQVLGAGLFLIGVGLLVEHQSTLLGVLLLAVALWALMVGRRPALK